MALLARQNENHRLGGVPLSAGKIVKDTVTEIRCKRAIRITVVIVITVIIQFQVSVEIIVAGATATVSAGGTFAVLAVTRAAFSGVSSNGNGRVLVQLHSLMMTGNVMIVASGLVVVAKPLLIVAVPSSYLSLMALWQWGPCLHVSVARVRVG